MTIWGIRLSVVMAVTGAIFGFTYISGGALYFKGLSVLAVALCMIALAATAAAAYSHRHPRTEPDEYDQW